MRPWTRYGCSGCDEPNHFARGNSGRARACINTLPALSCNGHERQTAWARGRIVESRCYQLLSRGPARTASKTLLLAVSAIEIPRCPGLGLASPENRSLCLRIEAATPWSPARRSFVSYRLADFGPRQGKLRCSTPVQAIVRGCLGTRRKFQANAGRDNELFTEENRP